MSSTGQQYNLFVAEPGKIVAEELGNELEDRA